MSQGDDEEEEMDAYHRAIMEASAADEKAEREATEAAARAAEEATAAAAAAAEGRMASPRGPRPAEAKGETGTSGGGGGSASDAKASDAVAPKEAVIKTAGGITREEAEEGGPALLHSGPRLGNLPAFHAGGNTHASPKKFQTDLDTALNFNNTASSTNSNSLFGANASPTKTPSLRADDKTAGGKKKKNGPSEEVPKDMPKEFLCQLTQRPMSDPMSTPYGNVYDRTAIINWLQTQGKICPLTGKILNRVYLCIFLFCPPQF
jgi:hypothetical protein